MRLSVMVLRRIQRRAKSNKKVREMKGEHVNDARKKENEASGHAKE